MTTGTKSSVVKRALITCPYVQLVPLILFCAANLLAADLTSHFTGKDACFLLLDLETDQTTVKFNETKCNQRLAACSTFKVPLALMAFDKSVLKNERDILKWDGKPRTFKRWDQDQTPQTWMENSTIWVSQEVAKKLGANTINKYLKDFGFSGADMAGGLETAWLTASSKTEKINTTVVISPYEQLEFTKKLWMGALQVSNEATELVKKLTFIEKSPVGFELSGKTGSGFVGGDRTIRIGWFVGHVKKGSERYIAVTAFTDAKPFHGKEYGGPEAREITKTVLRSLGKY